MYTKWDLETSPETMRTMQWTIADCDPGTLLESRWIIHQWPVSAFTSLRANTTYPYKPDVYNILYSRRRRTESRTQVTGIRNFLEVWTCSFGATVTSNGSLYMPQDCCPVCLSCLSLTLVYCGQMAGWIKMPLCTKVGLGPGDIVLDGDPAPPRKGAQLQRPFTFRPMSIVVKWSLISATAKLF